MTTPITAHDTPSNDAIPKHIAIIMDGNGRWAEARGLPRTAGHKRGVETVREMVRAAGDLGIEYLTLYSFSSENWSRPETEISELFSLLRMFIRRDLADLHKNNVRVKIIGSRERVPEDILSLIDEAMALTTENTGQTLVVAFNYGSRDEIISAVKSIAKSAKSGALQVEDITAETLSGALYTSDIPDPDLLIRTSGEVRLSNFLLWQVAYAEMIFIDQLWPDFNKDDLAKVIKIYQNRTRKFGGLAMESDSMETGS